MAGPVRLKSNPNTNITFESLARAINSIQDSLTQVQGQMNQLTTGNTLTIPIPSLPFKIAERADNTGIYVTVSTQVPATTATLRIQIIRVADNQKLSGDADDASAIKRAKRKVLRFDIEVSEDEAKVGVVEREIGPLKPKAGNDNAYNLVRLTATDDAGGKSRNPKSTPFSPTGPFATGAQLFPALVVDNGGIMQFTVGSSISSPPKTPALADIICNEVSTEGSTSTAKITVQVWADPTKMLTFQQVNATSAFAVFKQVNDPANQTVTGATGEVDNRLKFGGPLEDPTVNYVLIDATLSFGVQYEFKKAITTNATDKQVATATGLNFIAGKGLPVTNLLNRSLVATYKDGHHTLLTLTFTQPSGTSVCDSPVAYIKRIEYFVQEDTDAGFIRDGKEGALDNESLHVAGATIVLTHKIKHKANQIALQFKARIVGVGKDPIGSGNFVDVVSSGNSSTARTIPATPSLGDIATNLPDDDTAADDAFTVFNVYASTDKVTTYRQAGLDGAYIRLKRKAAATSSADDTTSGQEYGGPVDPSDLDSAFTTVTVRREKLGRRYIWVRNITTMQGQPIKSADGNVAYIAGYGTTGDATDITRLTFVTPISITRITKRLSKVSLLFQQPPIAQVPVLLKNAKVFQKLVSNSEGSTDTSFVKKDEVSLRDSPEFSDNTVIQPGQSDTVTKLVTFTVHHPANTSGLQYYVEVRAIGNATEYIGNNATTNFSLLVPFTDGNTGGSLSGNGPSPPLSSLLSNTVSGPDKTDGVAVTTIYCNYLNGAPVGGSTFQSVNASEAIAVFRRDTDAVGAEPLKFGGALTDTQLGAAFVNIECAGLRVGHKYHWVKNILRSPEGDRAVATGDVAFIAGNYDSTLTDITGLAITFTPQDSRHTLVTVQFTQPATPVFLRKIRLYESQSAVANDTLKIVDRINAIDDLATDGTSYNSSGLKKGTFIVKHKRPPNTVTYQFDLLAVGNDTPLASPTATEVVSDAEDSGPPSYSGCPTDPTPCANMKLRWKPSHLRAHIRKPDLNMVTFDRIKVRYQIKGLNGGVNYVWNPDDGTFNTGLGDVLPDTSVYNDTQFTADLGQATQAVTNADRPDTANPGAEFPSGAYSALVPGTSYVEITYYVYNDFGGPGNSFLKIQGKLIYNGNGAATPVPFWDQG